MKKVDFIIAFVIGELTAWYFVWLFSIKTVWVLPIVFPVLSIVCLYLAFLIGKRFLFIFQGAKFLLMGTLGALIDLGILNIFIWISGIAAGPFFSVFKGFSFIFATSSKYFGDKLWAFERKEMQGLGKEFSRFFLVTLGGLVINVTVASLMVNLVGPQFGLSKIIWANIGAIIAALSTAIWNFSGYKFIVFKK